MQYNVDMLIQTQVVAVITPIIYSDFYANYAMKLSILQKEKRQLRTRFSDQAF